MSGRKLRLPLTSSDGQVTAFSSSHFTRMLNDVLHFLTVPRFSCIMKPSTFVSESGEFIFPRFALFFFFHSFGIWDLLSIQTDSDAAVTRHWKLYIR